MSDIPAGDGKIANLFYSLDFFKAVNGLRISGLKLPLTRLAFRSADVLIVKGVWRKNLP